MIGDDFDIEHGELSGRHSKKGHSSRGSVKGKKKKSRTSDTTSSGSTDFGMWEEKNAGDLAAFGGGGQ